MIARVRSVRFVLGLAFLLAGASLFAIPSINTSEFDTRHWTSENGLPHDVVTAVQQTSDGFLWVGTARGLVRFDGWRFAPVSVATGTNGVQPFVPKVTALCVDSNDRLWFGTEQGGLFRLGNGDADRLSAFPVGLKGETIHCLDADDSGSVWIGTERGLAKWDNDRIHWISSEADLQDPAVLALQATRSSGIWLTTPGGLRKYQDGTMQRGEFDPATSQRSAPFVGVFEDRRGSLWGYGDTYLLNLSENRRFNYFRGGGATLLQIWSICEGRPGELWIGTSGQGLFHFNGNRFRAVDVWEGREHSGVRAVCLDQDGNLWVGTESGLLQLRERSVRWIAGPGSPATCLSEDWNGNVWAGFESGGLFMGRGRLLEPVSSVGVLGSQNLVTTLAFGGDSSLWVGTLGNGLFRAKDRRRVLQYTTANGLPDDGILAACRTGARIWVSTADGRLHRFTDQFLVTFDESNGLTGRRIVAISDATDDGLWLGTEDGEVLRGEGGRFDSLPDVEGFKGKRISALCQDTERKLWVGTVGGGLGMFGEGEWKYWNSTHGLPDNHILGIEQSLAGDIWVATSKGIIRIPPEWRGPGAGTDQKPPIHVDFPSDSVDPTLVGWPRSLRSRDGLLWFATDHGIVNFRPIELKPVPAASAVWIETVRANGELQTPAKPRSQRSVRAVNKPVALQLPSSLRDLEIRFTAPSLAFAERIRFRHKLEGFDADWQGSTSTRQARYGKLPAGDYRFVVEASDATGHWSGQETAIALIVPTPLWRTPGAIALQFVALITLVAGTVRTVSHRRLRLKLTRLEQQRAMERERTRIARDMHDKLGAKLTKISFVSERARHDLAQHAISSAKLDSIAVTSRELLHSLDEIVWAVNPSDDTLEHLAAYLGQYAQEYFQNTSVECEVQMPGALPRQPLSAEVRHNVFLAFEESLGNALKHSNATRIRIVMRTDDDEFHICISDNGCGMKDRSGEDDSLQPKARRRGMGLRTMSERLSQSGGRCDIVSRPNEGTTVTLSLALESKERKKR